MFLGNTLPYSHHSFLKTLKQRLSNAKLIFYNLCCLITFGISFSENNEEVSQSYVCFYWLPLFIHYLIYLCHTGNMHDAVQIRKHWQSTCKCRKGSYNSKSATWLQTPLPAPVIIKILGFGNFFFHPFSDWHQWDSAGVSALIRAWLSDKLWENGETYGLTGLLWKKLFDVLERGSNYRIPFVPWGPGKTSKQYNECKIL